jgi:hypothetical protein
MGDDVTPFIQAKSDQLNADDLIAGPVTVRIERVEIVGGEQPVVVHVSGHRPWKPCKTTMRVLALCWGPNTSAWVGRAVRLFRDPSVKYGGVQVGGIRVSGLSDIDRPMVATLATSKGKKSEHRIDVLPRMVDARGPDGRVHAGLLERVRRRLEDLGFAEDALVDYVAAVVRPGSAVAALGEWSSDQLTFALRHLSAGWATGLADFVASRPDDNPLDDNPFGPEDA